MAALTEMGGTPSQHPTYSPDLAPCDFWAFSTMKRELRGQNRLLHYPPAEAYGKRSAARFREVGGALYEVHRLPKEVLRKGDRHRTAKLTRLTHKIATQLHIVAEICTICNSRSKRPVQKLLDTLSYAHNVMNLCHIFFETDLGKGKIVPVPFFFD
jgi:hypothetical protein